MNFHSEKWVVRSLLVMVLALVPIRLILVSACFVKTPKLERIGVSTEDAAKIVDSLEKEFPRMTGPVKFSFAGLAKAFCGVQSYSIFIRVQRNETNFTANIDRSNDSNDRSNTEYFLNSSYAIVGKRSLKLAPRGWQEY